MRSFLIILVCFGAAFAQPVPLNLDDDLMDFIKLLPIKEIENIVLDYITNDAEVIEVLKWIQTSDEAKSLVYKVEALDAYKNFVTFLEDSGLHAYEYLNALHEFMGLSPYKPHASLHRVSRAICPFKHTPKVLRGTGLSGMIDDIIAILPIDELHDLFLYKLANSAEFKEMVDRIRSPEFQGMVDHLYEIREFNDVIDKLKAKGIDVEKYIELLRKLFGVDG